MSYTPSVAKKRLLSDSEIQQLNKKYHNLSPLNRIKELYKDFEINEVMLTSSFAATSAFFLRLFSKVNPMQPIFFIDTGFHFKETLTHKKELTRLYNLNVIAIRASAKEHRFSELEKVWTKDPDFCCYINKVEPLNKIKTQYTVWASGLMKWQSEHRSTLDIFEMRGDILKFYPLLDVSKKERDAYIANENLPFHPLVEQGYHSIGCKHCTVPGKDRNGRWNNNPKTECGLHL